MTGTVAATVAIVDYGSGNLRSAAKAFERAAAMTGGAWTIKVTADPDIVARADRIVLPGVGAFADCKAGVMAVDGLWPALEDAVQSRRRPFLGICVGMQLLAARGLEHGETPGFGWLDGEVRPIDPADRSLKVPHMGWNTLELEKPHPLFEGIATGSGGLHAYFVHGFHLIPTAKSDVLATTDYGGTVTAAVVRDNLAGTQFHPEKSQKLGLRLIANFLQWMPG